jgi:hypothetical protein
MRIKHSLDKIRELSKLMAVFGMKLAEIKIAKTIFKTQRNKTR